MKFTAILILICITVDLANSFHETFKKTLLYSEHVKVTAPGKIAQFFNHEIARYSFDFPNVSLLFDYPLN